MTRIIDTTTDHMWALPDDGPLLRAMRAACAQPSPEYRGRIPRPMPRTWLAMLGGWAP